MAKIAVIGAGPAGASAGYHLAKSSHHVTLIDKQAFPRDKACGDGLTLKSVEALSKMGISPEYLQTFASEFYAWNRALVGIYDQDFVTHLSDVNSGFCVPRYILDNLIYNRATESGCIPQQKAVGDINQFSVEHREEFDYIVDARGIFAGDCNAIAIREYWTIPLDSFSKFYDSSIQVYIDKSLGLDGYFWIFPVGQTEKLLKLNIGLGFSMDGYKKHKQNLICIFDDFIVEHRVTSQLLNHVVDRSHKKVYPLATTKWSNKIYENNIFKVGDAANLTEPLTGEGIANAINSGFYLAQAINHGGSLKEIQLYYQQFYKKYFEKDLRMQTLQHSILSLPLFGNFVCEMLSNGYISEKMLIQIGKFGQSVLGF